MLTQGLEINIMRLSIDHNLCIRVDLDHIFRAIDVSDIFHGLYLFVRSQRPIHFQLLESRLGRWMTIADLSARS